MSSPGKSRHDLPVLDEVTNLLEKERTLMGLKVLEQQIEAQDLKRKYEALVGQVAQAGVHADNARVFEIAADITATPVKIDNFRIKIMETIRSKGVNWVVDLTNIHVGVEGIVEVIKIFHGMRDSCKVTAILLRGCGLDSVCNEHMAALISFPYFEGIDASWNSLTRPFYDSLVKALEVRRRPPQYLLLNNNPDLANISFVKVLQVLSQETWGIVVTVKDATPVLAEQGQKQQKTAMCAADFLKVLNTQLVGNKKKTSASAAAALVGKQKSGIQLLAVLGLVNSTLSRISLKLLEDTLELACASLTDLDLSFSLIGYRGMELIRDAIVRPGKSQIVRLGLKGNAFTNSMIPLLGTVVERSHTLTYLDISNNQITGDGLLDLTHLMRNNFVLSTLCLTGNPIGQNSATLSQRLLTQSGCPVLIRWNGILSPTRISSNLHLAMKNSFIFSRLKRETTIVQPSGLDSVVYSVPVSCIQVKQAINFTKTASSIKPGAGKVKSHTDAEKQKKLLVEWNLRPRFEDATRLADLDKVNHRRRVNTVFMPMEWEIFVVTPQGRSSLARHPLRGGAGLPPGDSWVLCRAVVDTVPTHGHLEIVVRATRHHSPVDNIEFTTYTGHVDISGSASGEVLSKSAQFRTSSAVQPSVEVDSYGLNFSTYDDISKESTTFGEDVSEWSGTLNQVVSLRTAALSTMPTFSPVYEISDSISTIRAAGAIMKEMAGFPPAGHSVMRIFQWPGPMSRTATIKFETKLSSRFKSSTNGVEADWNNSSDAADRGSVQMAYECAVHLCFSHGQFETIGSCSLLPSGKFVGSEGFFIETSTDVGTIGAVLATWLWQKWKVSLPMIRPGDRVIITGRPHKSGINNPHNLDTESSDSSLAKCFIHCRGAHVEIPFDSFEGREELVGAHSSFLYAVHNDPTLFPCS